MNPIMQLMNQNKQSNLSNNNNNMLNQFMSFKNSFNGDDNQASEKIAQMLNSGQINRNDLNNAVQMAKQFRGLMGK